LFQETCELQPENILPLNYTGHIREIGEYPVKILNGSRASKGAIHRKAMRAAFSGQLGNCETQLGVAI
jgi:hypothetical protein